MLAETERNVAFESKKRLREFANNKIRRWYYFRLSSGTISEMLMKATVPGRGELNARLLKHLSPVTFSMIQRSVPITGRLNFYEKIFAYVLTNVTNGEEKAKKEFKRGDVAFMPSGSMICFFLQDTRSYKPMNPLGVVTSGLETLEASKRGDYLEIRSIVNPISEKK